MPVFSSVAELQLLSGDTSAHLMRHNWVDLLVPFILSLLHSFNMGPDQVHINLNSSVYNWNPMWSIRVCVCYFSFLTLHNEEVTTGAIQAKKDIRNQSKFYIKVWVMICLQSVISSIVWPGLLVILVYWGTTWTFSSFSLTVYFSSAHFF